MLHFTSLPHLVDKIHFNSFFPMDNFSRCSLNQLIPSNNPPHTPSNTFFFFWGGGISIIIGVYGKVYIHRCSILYWKRLLQRQPSSIFCICCSVMTSMVLKNSRAYLEDFEGDLSVSLADFPQNHHHNSHFPLYTSHKDRYEWKMKFDTAMFQANTASTSCGVSTSSEELTPVECHEIHTYYISSLFSLDTKNVIIYTTFCIHRVGSQNKFSLKEI